MAAFYSLTTTAVVMVILVLNADAVTEQQFQELSNLVREQSDECNVKIQELSDIIKMQRNEIKDLTEEVNNMKTAIKQQDMLIKNSPKRTMIRIHQRTLNDTLEERVTVLEIQMTDMREDLTTVQQDVADLDQDVNFLFDEQVIQDERLFQLETETEGIEEEVEGLQISTLELDSRVTTLEENGEGDGNSSVAELEVRVETLEETAVDHDARISVSELDINDLEDVSSDHETRLTAAEENIQGLQATDVSLEARVTALEENTGGNGSGNETIAFDAVITYDVTINIGSKLIFDEILSNEGEGYDSTTGVFTVPPSGDGWYYFFAHFRGDGTEYALFDIQINGNRLCTMVEDTYGTENGDDGGQGGCGTVVYAEEGDEVNVVYRTGSDTTLLWYGTSYSYHGFLGFRI